MAAPFTPEQRDALLMNHAMSVRVEVITSGVSAGQIPISGGQISATFTSQVTLPEPSTFPSPLWTQAC